MIFANSMTRFIMIMSYLFSIWVFVSSSTNILFWLTMELNLFILIMLMNLDKMEAKLSLLYIFSTQSFASLIFLSLMALDYFLDNMNMWDTYILCLLTFKLSLFPFYKWGLKFCQNCSNFIFFLFCSFQKIPFFFLILSTSVNWVTFSSINMMVGVFMAFFSLSLLDLLYFTSIYMTFWFMVFLDKTVMIFYTFLLFYLLFFYFICKIKNKTLNNLEAILVIFSLIFFFSLPPFSMFFMKFCMFETLILNLGYLISFLGFLGSFLILFAYTKFFYSFILIFYLYLKNMVYTFNYILILILVIFNMMFFF